VDTAAALAANIKGIRQLRGLTQAQLAALAEVPRSTLANLETGSSNPTLSVLLAIAAALRTSLTELLSPPPRRLEHFAAASLPVVSKGKGGSVSITKLLPHSIPGMEIDRMELASGARFAGVPHRPGTQEYLYCARGRIELWVAGDKLVLEQGDVASFAGDQRHSYVNSGRGIAVGFSVVTVAPVTASIQGHDGARSVGGA